jgi:hypothetical protein
MKTVYNPFRQSQVGILNSQYDFEFDFSEAQGQRISQRAEIAAAGYQCNTDGPPGAATRTCWQEDYPASFRP